MMLTKEGVGVIYLYLKNICDKEHGQEGDDMSGIRENASLILMCMPTAVKRRRGETNVLHKMRKRDKTGRRIL